MQIEQLDGAVLRAMIQAAASWLDVNKESVDALNVFPVPDGDTGTNMYLTLQAAVREVEKLRDDSASRVAEAAAQGSLMGARGNSGVILSQFFRGFAKAISGRETIDAAWLARGFHGAVRQAYQAVMRPVEGTVLTVAREAARAASDAARTNSDLLVVLEATLVQARRTLALTPTMLPVLREARVVDAGGKGLVVALEGAIRALQGGQVADWERVAQEEHEEERRTKGRSTGALALAPEEAAEALRYKYCTEFVLKGEARLNLERIKRDLGPHGDSMLVVGDAKVAKIHIHTNRPGFVLEYAVKLGDLVEIQINNMAEQNRQLVEEGRAPGNVTTADQGAPAEPPSPATTQPPKPIGVVAVVVGDGLEEVFRSLGADAVVRGGQSMNPSTEQILAAVEATNAEAVMILPNNSNVILTAGQVKDLTKKRVAVLTTKTLPQGIAALLAFDAGRSLEENVRGMSEAAGTVKTGEVTYAVRRTKFNGVEVEEKDFIGLFDDQIKAAGKSLPEVAEALIREMVGENSEIITVYRGADVEEEEAFRLAERIRALYPDCEVEVHYGGQPLYYYLISVE
ncbi:MAG TPA: DAK2 domain-containing protein [Firmicutes bacterium]|nr:DAK2 domain-containing protein [Bacillota bacterium]